MTERNEWSSTSPSQISTFRDCRRKWFRVSVLGERPPSSPAAERGSRIHEQIEQWLMNGIAPTDGTARAMLKHLPAGGSVSPDLVEQSFDLTPPGWSARVRGRIDLIDPETNQIIDHKSTASLSYAKSEEDLATDTQAIIYSAVALSGALNIQFNEPLRFTLSYGTTRGAVKTTLVSRTFTRAELETPLERIGSEVAEQKITSQALEWSEVEPNYQSCDKYGGCSFREDCTRAQRALVTIDEPSQASVDAFLNMLKGDTSNTPAPLLSVERLDHYAPCIDDLDATGSQYYNTNPPDGLPDREPLPEDQRPARRLPRFRWNDKSLSQMKAPELLQAIQELTAIMSPQTREAYDTHTKHLTKSTMSANKKRLETIHQINYGIIPIRDENESMTTDDFFDLFNPPPEEPSQETPAQETPAQETPAQETPAQETPAQETPAQEPPAQEPAQETAAQETPAQEPAQETPAQEPAQEPTQETPTQETPAQETPTQETPAQETPTQETPTQELPAQMTSAQEPARILLVDALATGGESADLLQELAPWIADIEARHKRPLIMIPYDEGWKQLGARLQMQGQWLFSKNIVTIESAHPLYKYCSHILASLSDIVIKGSR